MENVELGSGCDATTGEILSGSHEQLHEFVCAGLRREYGRIQLSWGRERIVSECDCWRNAE
jgi:hypothetical protein